MKAEERLAALLAFAHDSCSGQTQPKTARTIAMHLQSLS